MVFGWVAMKAMARVVAARKLTGANCFALFSAEEFGLFGSKAYVDALSPPDLNGLRAMINLDVVGLPEELELIGDADLTDLARIEAQKLGIDSTPATIPNGAGSDHLSFQRAGVPVLMLYRNDSLIHTPSDAIDRITRGVTGGDGDGRAGGAAGARPAGAVRFRAGRVARLWAVRYDPRGSTPAPGGILKLTRSLPIAASCLAAAVLIAACGGGGSSANNPSDVSKIATATLPAKLPDPKILSGGVVQAGSSSGRYTIKSGDTLSAIAASFGLTLDDLLAANPGIDPTALRAGDTIRLPETTRRRRRPRRRRPPHRPLPRRPRKLPPRRRRRRPHRRLRRRPPATDTPPPPAETAAPRRRPRRPASGRRTPCRPATYRRRSLPSSGSRSMRCWPPTPASIRRTCKLGRCW